MVVHNSSYRNVCDGIILHAQPHYMLVSYVIMFANTGFSPTRSESEFVTRRAMLRFHWIEALTVQTCKVGPTRLGSLQAECKVIILVLRLFPIREDLAARQAAPCAVTGGLPCYAAVLIACSALGMKS
jgi:hypothetical protein